MSPISNPLSPKLVNHASTILEISSSIFDRAELLTSGLGQDVCRANINFVHFNLLFYLRQERQEIASVSWHS